MFDKNTNSQLGIYQVPDFDGFHLEFNSLQSLFLVAVTLLQELRALVGEGFKLCSTTSAHIHTNT